MPKYIGFRILLKIPLSIKVLGGSCDLKSVLWDICTNNSAKIKIEQNKINLKGNGTKLSNIVEILKKDVSKSHIIMNMIGRSI